MTATDPWEALKDLGPNRSLLGMTPWLLLALLTHTGAVAGPQLTLLPMRQQLHVMRAELRAHFATIDIDVVEEPRPPEEKAEEPEPVPEPEPDKAPEPVPEATKAVVPKADDSYGEAPPPAAAQAPDVLHQADEPSTEDLTSWTMVHKDGSKVTGGGYTSGEGTALTPVTDRRATAQGREDGRGKAGIATAAAAPPPVSRSRAAMPQSRNLSDCPFPPQADMAQVDKAIVDVTVSVDPNGRAYQATVSVDPGYGFGTQAKRCALSMLYEPALNPAGEAIAGTTPTLRFRFSR